MNARATLCSCASHTCGANARQPCLQNVNTPNVTNTHFFLRFGSTICLPPLALIFRVNGEVCTPPPPVPFHIRYRRPTTTTARPAEANYHTSPLLLTRRGALGPSVGSKAEEEEVTTLSGVATIVGTTPAGLTPAPLPLPPVLVLALPAKAGGAGIIGATNASATETRWIQGVFSREHTSSKRNGSPHKEGRTMA